MAAAYVCVHEKWVIWGHSLDVGWDQGWLESWEKNDNNHRWKIKKEAKKKKENILKNGWKTKKLTTI